ncbi:MAG: hypothetical protein A2015_11525 [Spirochaetes bacterium GWF1_31_7]|nr:MAG: hypothetical protein A2Y30_15550 [Spirochaetes bacterium GWE1_32_154]OHD49053.1 MAG: hypothetical protein A2015_11525 [Spirochaetes bacterium GWF1_31_7]OHD50363.1 MAG: hypothetical protein A2Y29_13600 [Spirochaetes bacterium GWE2_31_10]HBD93848.1 bacitracin ABC transporter ATP-binding protein [Spirochaetia bacterium]HBI38845.1 bacitracin ABC transporter ATP-binding protein [Spirochaetia bacterium]
MTIHCSGITREYISKTDSIVALSSVSLTIQSALMTIIRGQSGSGKSTLLNICGLIDNNFDGTLIFEKDGIIENFNKVTITNKISDFRKNKIGYITQDFGLINFLTVYDNILLPFHTKPVEKQLIDKVNELSRMIGIFHLLKRYPESLSGGEKQRVALCRVFLKGPDILLADEPTARLDKKNADTVIGYLKELQKQYNKTVVIVTHDESVQGDRVITLKEGEVESII